MAEKRHLKKFENANNYDSEKDSLMEKPYVVLLADTGEVVFEGEQDEPTVRDYSLEYFTIENTGGYELVVNVSDLYFGYSIDGGEWGSSDHNAVTVPVGSKISIKSVDGYPIVNKDWEIGSGDGRFNVYGNIMSLIYGDDFEGKTDLSGYDYAFAGLFASTNVVDASNLILPATTLASSCYGDMFYGCTSLTTAPQLPATTLADSCYYDMFGSCTSLVEAPQLLATTLASNCYYSMFNGCTSLESAPELPATTLASSCYSNMFYGCTSLTTAPQLPATTLADNCYSYMFDGCTSLESAPELPATTLAKYCYCNMFNDCTSLVEAPQLPATTLASCCYRDMFGSCTSLITAPQLPAMTLADSCYESMFYGCTSLTTAPQLPATTLAEGCYESMFYECTSLIEAPQLLATILVSRCYERIFYGCSSLNAITMLGHNGVAVNATSQWVNGVAPSGVITLSSNGGLPATEGDGVPSGWSISEVP